MSKLFKSLYAQVIAAIIIGIALGYFFPEFATSLKPLGDGDLLYHRKWYRQHAGYKKSWSGRR